MKQPPTKRFAAILICLIFLQAFSGCTPSVNPPTAPGYTSQTDQTLGQTLAAAHAFYIQIQNDVNAGTYKPTDAEKAALNQFAGVLNVAQTAYLAYHSNPSSVTLATAQNAVNQVSTQQAALTAQIAGKP